MKCSYLVSLLVSLYLLPVQAQEPITARIIDSIRRTPIPFATVSVNRTVGVISSESGDFTLYPGRKSRTSDSLFISCLGYYEKAVAINEFKDTLVLLRPKVFELDEIILLNKNYTANEIMALVRDNLSGNYDHGFLKQKLFVRNSYYTYIDKKEAEMTSSTIPEFNQPFVDSLLRAIPDSDSDHSEILGNLYGKITGEDVITKLQIVRASHLRDENNKMSVDAITTKVQGIVQEHVKRDSYFKIKSGWIGTKTAIDSSFFGDDTLRVAEKAIEAQVAKAKARRERFLHYQKQQLSELQGQSFIPQKSDLNFIHKYRKYTYTLEHITALGGDVVYKIVFEPRRNADYHGTLYINADDFAVLRADYENVGSLRSFRLFGVSLDRYRHRGTLHYEKNERGKYALKYAMAEYGQKTGFKRPLKIIEKNRHVKGRRKQNEVAADVHVILRNTNKSEMIVYETEPIGEVTFAAYTEAADVSPVYLKAYDPAFWEGYNIIAPDTAIKEFRGVED